VLILGFGVLAAAQETDEAHAQEAETSGGRYGDNG
jgi:hypothetical protein